jgi:hypothetical protein
VLDARPICRSAADDRFSLLLMNKSVLRKTSLEGEYQTLYFHPSTDRLYSISYAMRIQEIENYGQPTERKLSDGAGSGYIWRIASFTRLPQRDDGVYMEVEAIVLSRDIPAAFVGSLLRSCDVYRGIRCLSRFNKPKTLLLRPWLSLQHRYPCRKTARSESAGHARPGCVYESRPV